MTQTPPITSLHPTMNDRFCEHVKADGSRCGGYRQKDSTFCFAHNPMNKDAMNEARKRGGKRSQAEGITDWTNRELKTVRNVEELVQDLLNATIRGDVHPRVVNAASGLLNMLLKAKELGGIEERLAELEKKAGIV